MIQYITYKFYNERRQRLAIKAEEYNNRLLFSVVACSHEDQFNKKIARNALSGSFDGSYHPEKFSIPIVDKKGGKTFINYCNENYYRLRALPLTLEVEVLTKNIKHLGDIYDKIDNSKIKAIYNNRVPLIY